jgi:ubiquinone/menaquinone biosynthesis C-methylase UbiE
MVKKYFKKDAEKNKRFYSSRSRKEVENKIKKRYMWKTYHEILDQIINKNTNISSVIDIACGMGNLIIELSKHNNFKRIVGIDFLKETFSIAWKSESIFGNISFLQGDLINLPFNNQSFDFSICINTLHHIHNKDFNRAINELTRITKHYLMIEIRNKDCIFLPWFNQIIMQKVYSDLPIYCNSVQDITSLMENNGFILKIIRGKRKLSMASWRLVLVYKRK